MPNVVRLPTLEELLSGDAGWRFGTNPVDRIFRTAAIIGVHVRYPETLLGYLDEVQSSLAELHSNIDRMLEFRRSKIRGRDATTEKPAVHFVIEMTEKGNLRVSYFPVRPSDFGQSRYQYGYHSGNYPVNQLIFMREFVHIWDTSTDIHPSEALDRVIRREILETAVGVVEEAAALVAKHCVIATSWKFERSDGDPSGYELVSPEEFAERDERRVEAERVARDNAAEEDRKAKLAVLASWKDEYGMEPARILAVLEGLRAVRIPLPGCVEIMVRNFGLTRPDDVAMFEGLTRRMRNRLAALGIPMEEADITHDEARALARQHLGAVRKPWPPKGVAEKPIVGKPPKRRLPYTDYSTGPRKRKPLEM